jgi:hypothetical protein
LNDLESLSKPERLYSWHELNATTVALAGPGAYAFWFKKLPGVPIEDCLALDGYYLCYVGVANGQTLFSRLHKHFCETASVSTLRLTIGCLLSMPLQRAGKAEVRFVSECTLSEWLQREARISFIGTTEPHAVEAAAVQSLSLPLNLKGNRQHSFYPQLAAIRRTAKRLIA